MSRLEQVRDYMRRHNGQVSRRQAMQDLDMANNYLCNCLARLPEEGEQFYWDNGKAAILQRKPLKPRKKSAGQLKSEGVRYPHSPLDERSRRHCEDTRRLLGHLLFGGAE
ncbi:hypothetical protein AN401_07065 [Zobellella denitrificans]|uniref:Uncharacterized protein n=1 Tax=Zobellella denitrificans TaxID=347534 RepID=A0A291HND1_9GAMM|nr:hypothetical protein [Zobellella denitrificans]ATG73644.1 hypothetical protein AN401_07065 [Zobellella denitrificans]